MSRAAPVSESNDTVQQSTLSSCAHRKPRDQAGELPVTQRANATYHVHSTGAYCAPPHSGCTIMEGWQSKVAPEVNVPASKRRRKDQYEGSATTAASAVVQSPTLSSSPSAPYAATSIPTPLTSSSFLRENNCFGVGGEEIDTMLHTYRHSLTQSYPLCHYSYSPPPSVGCGIIIRLA